MRTLVHLSDLHFGRVDDDLLPPLIETVHGLKPDVVVVSGDLTQRARRHELRAARAFLDRLPQPQIVVPGNHDVPFHDVTRLFRPLHRFRTLVVDDVTPFFVDDKIAVLGLNTTRALSLIEGRINEQQMTHARSCFAPLDDHVAKIIVTHHPLDTPSPRHRVVGRSAKAMHVFASIGVDLLLSGHLHQSHAGHAAEQYVVNGHQILLAHAGTATSTRVRGEANAFNVIHVMDERIHVERRTWSGSAFVVQAVDEFTRMSRANVHVTA